MIYKFDSSIFIEYVYSSTLNLIELLYKNMFEYQNGRIRLGIRSKYKTGFEFSHFLDEYELSSFLTNRIRVRTELLGFVFSPISTWLAKMT